MSKNIILIAIPNYANGIIKKMKELGYNVFFIADKPKESFFSKVLGRLKTPIYKRIIIKYYRKKISLIPSNVDIDYVLVIRGEYTPEVIISDLKDKYNNAKKILYMWDSIKNNKGIEKKWKFYDKVYTFDRKDYMNYMDKISFLPLFYYEDCLPNISNIDIKYSMSFIGTAHEDRIYIVNKCFDYIGNLELPCFKYYYLPHYFIFLKNKIFNNYYKGVRKKHINFKQLPFEELYNIYASSKCILDIESPRQTGLTMRTIEIIGLHKKLITTNKDIINYDFYNKNNILVIDRENPYVDIDFINSPYEELDEQIYKEYSLKNWIIKVLGGNI